ncbi:MAG: MFS transporter [Agarilytica sp.]
MFSEFTPAQRVQFGLILLVAMLYFCAASMMLYLSKFVVDLGGNAQQAGALLGVGLIAMIVLAPFIGGLSDKFGSKPLVMLGLFLYGSATYAHIYIRRRLVSNSSCCDLYKGWGMPVCFPLYLRL